MNNKFGIRGVLFSIIMPVLALFDDALAGLLVYYISGHTALIISMCLAGYAVLLAVACLIAYLKRGPRESKVKRGPVLGNVMYDKINYAEEPAFICDQNH